MSIKKRLASAAFQLTLSHSVMRLLSIVTMPILTHLLAPEAYGAAALAGTVISLISVIALSGMDMSYARSYFAKENPAGKAVEIFAWRYALSVGLIAAMGSALAWWFILADVFHLPRYLAALIGAGVFLAIANTMAQTRARLENQYRRMSIALVLSGISAALISVGVAMWWRHNELPLVLSVIAASLVPVLVLGTPSLKILFSSSGLSSDERKFVLKIGLAGIITAPMYWVMASLDRWFLGYYETSAIVGIYAVAYSVASMGMIINTALASVWLPEATKAFEQHQETARIDLGHLMDRLVVILALVWLVVTAAGGDVIRFFAAEQFHQASEIVPYIAGAIFFHGVLTIMNANVLLKHKFTIAMWWWSASALVCILFNFLLVPTWGNWGAAVTQVLSFAFCAAGMLFSSQRFFPLAINIKKLMLVILLIFPTGIVMSSAWDKLPLLSLLLKIPLGMLVTWLVVQFIMPELFGIFLQWLPFKKYGRE